MDNILNMPSIEEQEWSDQATTCAGSSPSNTSHSPSLSTEKTLLSSLSSGVPGVESVLSVEALNALQIVNDVVPLKVGWPRLAWKMADDPDLESFCRFRELNVKNLLYYQVEIAELEAELIKVEKEDAGKCGADQKEGDYARYATKMLLLGLKPKDRWNLSPEERKQCDLVLKIRERLREYSKMTPNVFDRDTNVARQGTPPTRPDFGPATTQGRQRQRSLYMDEAERLRH